MDNINITFSTCWYNFKAKFEKSVYDAWIDNMLSNVNNYYLVIYTDELGSQQFQKYAQSKIKIIVKPYTDFFSHKHEKQWINNHDKNIYLKNMVDWKVNMLWSEKINFVKDTVDNKYFETEYYGWCDIGYFRNRNNDLSKEQLVNWPNNEKVLALDKNKIHYALVNNNSQYMNSLFQLINIKNEKGLPNQQIPPNQISIAAGFFILHKTKINWWHETYYNKLQLYFDNNYLVKDDQVIVIDNICSDVKSFCLHMENDRYDNWFMFQRKLI